MRMNRQPGATRRGAGAPGARRSLRRGDARARRLELGAHQDVAVQIAAVHAVLPRSELLRFVRVVARAGIRETSGKFAARAVIDDVLAAKLRGVAVIDVDAGEGLRVFADDGGHVLDDDFTRGLLAAISA